MQEDLDNKNENKRPKNPKLESEGLVIGAALGFVIGIIFDNFVLGFSIGIGIGVAMGDDLKSIK